MPSDPTTPPKCLTCGEPMHDNYEGRAECVSCRFIIGNSGPPPAPRRDGDAMPAGDGRCNCWLGTSATSGDSSVRERCPVHGLYAEIRALTATLDAERAKRAEVEAERDAWKTAATQSMALAEELSRTAERATELLAARAPVSPGA